MSRPENALIISLRNLEFRSATTPEPGNGWFEFHISRDSRIKYKFDEGLFSSSGNVIFPDYRSARVFAQNMNAKRDVVNFPERAVKAGQINAMALIDEILHYVAGLYREQIRSDVIQAALEFLSSGIGEENLETLLLRFVRDFPPLAVHQQKIDAEAYLQGQTSGVANRQIVLEELIMLWLANANPAFSVYGELFDDTRLGKETVYQQAMEAIGRFFEEQTLFGPDHQTLIEMLRSPAIAEPHSLTGQLEYIRKRWGLMLGKYLFKLLSSLDFIREEEKMFFGGKGSTRVYEFGGEGEAERFSPDKEWMPKLVLIAKSSYVWLDQLSRKYQRSITRLDQIPDEELDDLARWGFTGLWLIGLWERSKASQRIKQMCGNPEAVASAYSLLDYEIAGDLGGDDALHNLKERAWKRGIRLGSDMVPNHMAIDSRWLVYHPDWFVSLDYSPFPSYSFNGVNLSWDDRVGIYLEDHYYDRTDAAVVFKRVDFHTGDTKYVYHGNDGTSMPWNDTAQLNYLIPEVREAVIKKIINIARNFPIIRFDAAMTLAKKHYQRLWFPEPGGGGDIASRAGLGLTREQFDQLMPVEFWREVVDRVAQEIPDTLLLAEAFWLMESYFVRTLGMHRVYNSAFMNMLKNEENSKYRQSIRNVLEFNPEILKRFVNFMNNPDEETAVAQFGKDDKYFGVCIMMVTMPGLPMFGHGQIEGFREKYGMEYRRAYWNEEPDLDLVRRHEREVFPLMRKRYLFAGVENFLLYDFFAPEGYVNENVFAYSNSAGNEKGLVVYNNKYEEARGWIKTSAAFSVNSGNGDSRALRQKSLGEGLHLHYDDNYFVIFRDQISGLEFIRNCRKLHEEGLYVNLGAFRYQVFLDFREVQDNVWKHYANLASYLDGRGVPSVEEALKETFLKPIHEPLKELVNTALFQRIGSALDGKKGAKADEKLIHEILTKYERLLKEVRNFTGSTTEISPVLSIFEKELRQLLELPSLAELYSCKNSRKYQWMTNTLRKQFSQDRQLAYTAFAWLVIYRLGQLVEDVEFAEQSRGWIEEWLFGKILAVALQNAGLTTDAAWHSIGLIKILISHHNWWEVSVSEKRMAYGILQQLLGDPEVQTWLQINRYHEVLWFNKEAFEELRNHLLIIGLTKMGSLEITEDSEFCQVAIHRYDPLRKMKNALGKSEFQVEKLLQLLKK